MLILKEYKKMSADSLILEFYIHMTSSVFSKIFKQHNLQDSYLKTLMPDQKPYKLILKIYVSAFN